MKPKTTETLIAAIDVGPMPSAWRSCAAFPTAASNRCTKSAIRSAPARGLFQTGIIPPAVVDRLVGVLRRYAIICKRHHAHVRAVGTSALREAKNRDDIIRRVKREAGLDLEAISGKEEARLMCLGVLSGRPPKARSLCLDIGGGSTEVAGAVGDQPSKLWSVAIGSVRLTEIFKSHREVSPKQLRLLREFAREAVEDSCRRGSVAFRAWRWAARDRSGPSSPWPRPRALRTPRPNRFRTPWRSWRAWIPMNGTSASKPDAPMSSLPAP
jgi:exopolyphosphatase/guanosine-5'-triphosphate,3'-diphosphate pyrophosphatase